MFVAAKRRTLPLPIDGTVYQIPSPDAETGIYLTNLKLLVEKVAAGGDVSDEERALLNLDDKEEVDFYQRVLGPAYDQMIQGGVDYDTFRLASQTVMEWVTKNRAAAEQYWNAAQADDLELSGEDDPKAAPTEATETPAPPDSPASSTSPRNKDGRGRTSSTTSSGRSSKQTSKTEA